jgi:AraC family transcriptional regulator of adaptative response / DNA-3-methyladenine glycosylase II
LALRLDYRPPLPWELLLDHMRVRAVGGVEHVQGSRYLRTVALGETRGWWALEPEAARPALRLTVSVSLLPVLRQVVRRVRQQWDLDARPDVIEAHLSQFSVLRRSLTARSGLRVLGAWEAFEGSVRILLNQQNSVASAATLATRLVARAGLQREGGPPGLTALFPSAALVASWTEDEVAALGLPRRRAAALLALARVWGAEGVGAREADASSTFSSTCSLPDLAGIGPWTRDLFALRVGRHPDTFPAEDLVLKRVLGLDAKAARKTAEAWRPWRSYAAMHLWAEAAAKAAGGSES